MRKIRIFEHTSLDGVIAPEKRNEGDDDIAISGLRSHGQLMVNCRV
jgi:hypothetical protein